MTEPINRDAIYRRRRFPRDVIETCVRWYLTYRLSYRDLVALMSEREVHVTHTTIMRWVLRYVPEYEKRWNCRAKPVGSSWRVDETCIRVRPKMGYLYRAVDKEGKTVQTLGQNDVKEQTATNKVKPTDWRNGILTAPHGLDFDDKGNLYVTEFNEFGRVVRYDLGMSSK